MAEHDTKQLAEIGEGGTVSGIPMADENDKTYLSDSLAFLRRQLEYFQAVSCFGG